MNPYFGLENKAQDLHNYAHRQKEIAVEKTISLLLDFKLKQKELLDKEVDPATRVENESYIQGFEDAIQVLWRHHEHLFKQDFEWKNDKYDMPKFDLYRGH